MNRNENIKIGTKRVRDFIVEESFSTNHMGGGSTYVLATPAMIAYMEQTSNNLLKEFLSDGFSSVGTSVNIRHLAPTPMGSTVQVSAEVVEVKGNAIELKVSVYQGDKLVGDGYHGRHIIDNARFIKGVTNE
jgi:fluoroacetyl-CoA thioesterase